MRTRKFESYKLHGLEFARTKGDERDRVLFGVSHYPDEIAAKVCLQYGCRTKDINRPETSRNWKNWCRKSSRIAALVPDLRHPFYRLRTEAWLESLLRRDIRVLDAALDPRFVYSQVPAWIGDDRSDPGFADRQSPGPSWWSSNSKPPRTHNFHCKVWITGCASNKPACAANLRGVVCSAGLALADQSPLLYLVAPRLRFHRSFSLVANCIAPELKPIASA